MQQTVNDIGNGVAEFKVTTENPFHVSPQASVAILSSFIHRVPTVQNNTTKIKSKITWEHAGKKIMIT